MLFVQKHLSALYRSRILPLPVVIEYATSHRRVFVETRNNRRDRRSLNAIISGLEGDIHGARDQHSTAHLSKVRLSLASGNHKGTVQDTCSARRSKCYCVPEVRVQKQQNSSQKQQNSPHRPSSARLARAPCTQPLHTRTSPNDLARRLLADTYPEEPVDSESQTLYQLRHPNHAQLDHLLKLVGEADHALMVVVDGDHAISSSGR